MNHSPGKEALALYGSLMRGLGGMESAGVRSGIRYVGPCIIEGILFDLGSYPGVLPGVGRVRGELYHVDDVWIWDRLDAFEGFDSEDEKGSLFLRRRVRLLEPGQEASIYFYNRDVAGRVAIGTGDWRAHLAQSSEP